MTQIRFNISPTALNQANESELVFFYQYIEYRKPDEEGIKCYGDAGTVSHDVLENVTKGKLNENNWYDFFERRWVEKNLLSNRGIKNELMSKPDYKKSVERGIELLKTKYDIKEAEMQITIPFVNNGKHIVNFKGKIDNFGVLVETGELVVMDWKTSSSTSNDPKHPKSPYSNFHLQGLFYPWLIWKKHNIIVQKSIFEYIKIGKVKEYEVNEKILREFEVYLFKRTNELIAKGNIIDNFEIGDISSVWNNYKPSCQKEILRRSSKQDLIVERGRDNICTIKTKIYDSRLLKALREKYSYEVDGHEYSEKFKKHIWDGRKYLFHNNMFPYPFINNIKKFLEAFNNHFKTNYNLILKQPYLNEKITSKKYDTVFKERKLIPRYYQNDAKDVALLKKIGILYLGTSAGKTLISTEIIRSLDNRILFVVNTLELAYQSHDEFQKQLGVEVGLMTEGELSIDKQITVAGIHTISAILDRGDETSKELLKYLYNVNCIIYDEAQNLNDKTRTPAVKNALGEVIKKSKSRISMYGKLGRTLTNCEYFIGLSGSPRKSNSAAIEKNGIPRGINGSTLEMNALIGFVEYSKPTSELEAEGFVTPTKCLFINNTDIDTLSLSYNDYFNDKIVCSEKRNQMVFDLVEKYRHTKKILIITKTIPHGRILHDEIEGSYLINSKTNKKARKENFEDFKNSRDKVLIGGIQIFKAGIDIPDLDMVINVSGCKDENGVIQSCGRTKRQAEGKKYGYYIDFQDNIKYFDVASEIRKNILVEYGNKVEVIDFIDLEKAII